MTLPTPSDLALDVRAALDRLDPDLAEILRLVHWDGFTISEAAHILELPASTARSRHQKAKRDLGALLTSAPLSSARLQQTPTPTQSSISGQVPL